MDEDGHDRRRDPQHAHPVLDAGADLHDPELPQPDRVRRCRWRGAGACSRSSAAVRPGAGQQMQIVEDDSYALTRFEGEREPALFDLSGRTTLYISSFSTTIAPGLRVGWLILPKTLVGRVSEARGRDVHHAVAARPGDRVRVHQPRRASSRTSACARRCAPVATRCSTRSPSICPRPRGRDPRAATSSGSSFQSRSTAGPCSRGPRESRRFRAPSSASPPARAALLRSRRRGRHPGGDRAPRSGSPRRVGGPRRVASGTSAPVPGGERPEAATHELNAPSRWRFRPPLPLTVRAQSCDRPRRAPRSSFALLALRARCRRHTSPSGLLRQGPSGTISDARSGKIARQVPKACGKAPIFLPHPLTLV